MGICFSSLSLGSCDNRWGQRSRKSPLCLPRCGSWVPGWQRKPHPCVRRCANCCPSSSAMPKHSMRRLRRLMTFRSRWLTWPSPPLHQGPPGQGMLSGELIVMGCPTRPIQRKGFPGVGHMPVMLALRRPRQEQKYQSLKACGDMARPCPKREETEYKSKEKEKDLIGTLFRLN